MRVNHVHKGKWVLPSDALKEDWFEAAWTIDIDTSHVHSSLLIAPQWNCLPDDHSPLPPQARWPWGSCPRRACRRRCGRWGACWARTSPRSRRGTRSSARCTRWSSASSTRRKGETWVEKRLSWFLSFDDHLSPIHLFVHGNLGQTDLFKGFPLKETLYGIARVNCEL